MVILAKTFEHFQTTGTDQMPTKPKLTTLPATVFFIFSLAKRIFLIQSPSGSCYPVPRSLSCIHSAQLYRYVNNNAALNIEFS